LVQFFAISNSGATVSFLHEYCPSINQQAKVIYAGSRLVGQYILRENLRFPGLPVPGTGGE
jgi:hypothetical protein